MFESVFHIINYWTFWVSLIIVGMFVKSVGPAFLWSNFNLNEIIHYYVILRCYHYINIFNLS